MNECLTKVKGKLLALDRLEPTTHVFLFGSTLRGKPDPADLDLLIVYASQADLEQLKRVLVPLLGECPLDLLYASTAEAQELNLIESMETELIL